MKFRWTCALLVFAHTACASLFASSSDTLYVRTSPGEAQVTLNGSVVGPAPQGVEIPRRGGQSLVEVTASGYEPGTCRTAMTVSGGYLAADIALCALLFPIGCISFVDATGAWNRLDAPQCHVTLRPQVPGATAK